LLPGDSEREEIFVLPYVGALFPQVIFRDSFITTFVGDDPDELPRVLQEMPLLKLSFVCQV
jgi:hypothetical protein